MFARRVAEENNRSEQLGQIRGALLLLCVLRTVCIFVFVCGESSALSLAICFPGGPTGASPASRGGPDSSGIWRTGPVGLPGESSSHISASSPSASTFFFLSSLLVWCCFVSGDLFRARHTFLLLSLSCTFLLAVPHLVPTRLGFLPGHTVSQFSLCCSLSPLHFFSSRERGPLAGWDGLFLFLSWLSHVGEDAQGGSSDPVTGTEVATRGRVLQEELVHSRGACQRFSTLC